MADEEEENWAPIPKIRPANCPPGLECLMSVDQVIIGFGKGNRHSVNNSKGQKLFYVLDGSNCCIRSFCCNCKPFKFELLDHHGNELIQFHRSCCCCCCLLPGIRVYAPPGSYIGEVKLTSRLFKRSYTVKNAEGQTLLLIKEQGGCCRVRVVPTEYKVLSLPQLAGDSPVTVGRMSRSWADLDKFLIGKYVGISFPLDLDVRLKTVLIGACFLTYKK